MANPNAIPNAKIPFLGEDGSLSLPWRLWAQNLTGGSTTPEDIAALQALVAALSAEVATAASNATTALLDAQAALSGAQGTLGLAASLLDNAGSVTITGAPLVGNLTQWSGPTSITNGDLSGDATTTGTLAVTLATVNANVGSFGDSTHVGAVTVNAKGLVTAASSVAIAFPSAPIPTFGSGAPSTLVFEGALYFDTTGSPYHGYVQHTAAWHQFS